MRILSFLLLFGCVAVLTGCADSEPAADDAPADATPAAEGDDHADHDGDDHAAHDGDHAGEAAVAMNANCPIMGSPVKPDGGSADYNGKTVGFCCPGCVDKWTSLSDEDKAKKLAEANPEAGETPDA